jgi:hypothetical protein
MLDKGRLASPEERTAQRNLKPHPNYGGPLGNENLDFLSNYGSQAQQQRQ